MIEDQDVRDYKRREISWALSGKTDDVQLKLKIFGAVQHSKHLNVTEAEVLVIREVLGGGSTDDITRAMADVIAERDQQPQA